MFMISNELVNLIIIFIFLKSYKTNLQNHSNGQICSVLAVGWPILSGFAVEGCEHIQSCIIHY